jgi:peptidoglycan DL-endopeptidase CwlO
MTKLMSKLVICLAVAVVSASAQASGNAAAQVHARKANGLAAAGKCKQAIPEYNVAYRLLKDPALLFNRAECLRKVGQAKQALSDYRRFLEELPTAPNRQLVESRIAALDPAAAAIEAKPIVQAPPVEAPPAPLPAPAPAPEPLPPLVKEPAKEPAEPALHAAALRMPLPAAEPPPAPAAVEPAPMLVARRPPPAPLAVDTRAWIWLSVAAVVVAGAAGGAMYVSGKPRNP